jgi:hypothetical protein
MASAPRSDRARKPLRRALALVLALAAAAPTARAEPPDAPDAPAPTDAARRSAIKGLKSTLRRLANSPYADSKQDEIRKTLESLASLGGPEAGEAALEGVVLTEEATRDAVFAIVEREHDPSLVEPLAALLEDNRFRRDADLRRRVAHALAVMAAPDAVEPLAGLVRFDEDAEVVAEAAESLATYGAAPLATRKEAVRRLVDLYETTWNYKMSVRPEDKVLSRVATERWTVYARSVRTALQSLTGRQLSRPQEWREWWNENKKKSSWDPERERR